jgi:hypothetical protein
VILIGKEEPEPPYEPGVVILDVTLGEVFPQASSLPTRCVGRRWQKMAAPDEKLHGKQAAAIAALLSHRTIAEAAHQVGIGERTLLRWLQEDRAFQGTYRTARRHVVQHAVAQVQQATSTAVATLAAIWPNSTDGARMCGRRRRNDCADWWGRPSTSWKRLCSPMM